MSDHSYIKVFSNNLRHLMLVHDKKQADLVQDLGFTKSTVSSWCTGTRAPRMDKVEKLAQYFGVQKSDLIEEKREKCVQRETTALCIPVLRCMPAGLPIEKIDDIEDWEEVSEGLARGNKHFFGLVVKGDAMAPKYLDGDRIIVEMTQEWESGTDCIVYIDGQDATLKKVIKSDSEIILQSLNPAYEPIIRRLDNDQDGQSVRIAGRVIEIRRRI